MQIIHLKDCAQVTGGLASIQGSMITVTGPSQMVFQGFEFDSHGVIKDLTGDIHFNAETDGELFCYGSTLFSISPILDGYQYHMSAC